MTAENIVPLNKNDPFGLEGYHPPKRRPGRPRANNIEAQTERVRTVNAKVSASLAEAAEIYIAQIPEMRYMTDFVEFAMYGMLKYLNERYPDQKIPRELVDKYDALQDLEADISSREQSQKFWDDMKKEWEREDITTETRIAHLKRIKMFLPVAHPDIYDRLLSLKVKMEKFIARDTGD